MDGAGDDRDCCRATAVHVQLRRGPIRVSAIIEVSLRSLLEALSSLSPHARLVTLDGLPSDVSLVVERASGHEAINQPYRFDVDLLSPSAQLSLSAFIGLPVSLGLLTADGTRRRWHGLITTASRLAADGGVARYRVQLESPLAWLALREDCYLFQDANALDIAESLFGDYPTLRYDIRIDEATRARLPVYRVRTQWRETDLAFLQRLLADDGISYAFEHPDDAGTGEPLLVLFVDSPLQDEATVPAIRYHRSAATEFDDAIHGFTARRSIASGSVLRSRWDAEQVRAPASQALADPGGPLVPDLEDHDGSLSLPPTASPSADAVAHRASVAAKGHAQTLRTWRGQSSVRRLAAGTAFVLTDHPDYGPFSARGFGNANPEARFLVTDLEHRMRNNLRLGGDRLDDGEPIYENRFGAIPADVPIVQAATAGASYPGLQTALVVGIANQVLTAERDHEVKAQFHWQRGVQPNRGGLSETGSEGDADGNAPGNERSGTWIRVAQAIAGPDFGEVYLPRIGDEVLIDFEHGDPDRPIIVGALWNGEDLPPFSAGVDTESTHPGVISGIHTKTLDGGGYNELVFDDASGQPGVRAASSSFSSQLNLGHLLHTRPGLAWRGTARGQGFEWTTDGWTVARAEKGLLLSTTLRAQASGTVFDTTEAQGQLKAAQSLAQTLSDAAAHQGAKPLTAMAQQTRLLDTLAMTEQPTATGSRPQPAVPALDAPIVLLEAPASISFTTPATMLSHASLHHSATIQGDALASAGKVWSAISGGHTSLYTHTGGIAAIAANHPVSIQAQTDALEILADKSVTVTSTESGITVVAEQKIVLLAGGASITLDGENITFACPGTFSVKGAKQDWGSAAKGQASLPVLPDGTQAMQPQPYSLRWKTVSAVDGLPLPDVDVIAIDRATGKIAINEKTGGDGRTSRHRHEWMQKQYAVLVGSGDWTALITTEDEPATLESNEWLDEEAENE